MGGRLPFTLITNIISPTILICQRYRPSWSLYGTLLHDLPRSWLLHLQSHRTLHFRIQHRFARQQSMLPCPRSLISPSARISYLSTPLTLCASPMLFRATSNCRRVKNINIGDHDHLWKSIRARVRCVDLHLERYTRIN